MLEIAYGGRCPIMKAYVVDHDCINCASFGGFTRDKQYGVKCKAKT